MPPLPPEVKALIVGWMVVFIILCLIGLILTSFDGVRLQ